MSHRTLSESRISFKLKAVYHFLPLHDINLYAEGHREKGEMNEYASSITILNSHAPQLASSCHLTYRRAETGKKNSTFPSHHMHHRVSFWQLSPSLPIPFHLSGRKPKVCGVFWEASFLFQRSILNLQQAVINPSPRTPNKKPKADPETKKNRKQKTENGAVTTGKQCLGSQKTGRT